MADPSSPLVPTEPPRRAGRVLLIDARDRVLLFRFEDRVHHTSFWVTPGGGLDGDETFAQAARRELREETGLRLHTPLDRHVWERAVTIRWGTRCFEQRERFFVHRVNRHRVSDAGLLDYERDELMEHRWWSADEIAASDERFAPARLAQHLAALLSRPPPVPLRLDA